MDKIVTDKTFDTLVLKAQSPVLVDFWATWCKPCLGLSPVLDEIEEAYVDRLIVLKLDVDQNPKTIAKYHVMSIPTMIIFKQGKPVFSSLGFSSKEKIKRTIDKVLNNHSGG